MWIFGNLWRWKLPFLWESPVSLNLKKLKNKNGEKAIMVTQLSRFFRPLSLQLWRRLMIPLISFSAASSPISFPFKKLTSFSLWTPLCSLPSFAPDRYLFLLISFENPAELYPPGFIGALPIASFYLDNGFDFLKERICRIHPNVEGQSWSKLSKKFLTPFKINLKSSSQTVLEGKGQ